MSPEVVHASVDELITRAKTLVMPSQRTILGITGAPGAGKSTLCEALRAALGSDTAVVGMDGFHLANSELRRLGRASRKGAPDTFDAAGYAALLERLRTDDGVVYAPLFDRSLEESINAAIPIPADARLILTEGNYLLTDSGSWPRARAAMDQVWFLELPGGTRRQRLVARHEAHGRTASEAAEWVRDVDEQNAELIEKTRYRADVVVTLADSS
ncbi:nucleoside/nucleotide kinase family protein [Antrihabitans sp. YC3-6]|uniref:Nucleoside/nucleotide kinase family protein n=1 Tax=Antrihabitans stalagmiti TaxID=2799499 RepID=A0A934NV94_9NOCA|nr:nucleoside/nucleotide kinase family protein [Antrihabitans stalagmiti]MBJ8341842.1 nucleoside/nucleotide kinase family protein [Antrihabitans stalagmiti]